MRSRLRDRMKTRTLRSPALWWPAWPPVTSFVGDRRQPAISFLSVAVTRPPLRSGRDTSPWFAPSPSKPLRGFQGAGRLLPTVETVRSGAPETQVKRSSRRSSRTCSNRTGRCAHPATGVVVSACRLFPRFRRRVPIAASQRGLIEICTPHVNRETKNFTCRE